MKIRNLLACVLILVMIFTLVSCEKDTGNTPADTTTTPQGNSGTTVPQDGSDTTAPQGSDTTAPQGSDTTAPQGSDTTAPQGSDTTAPQGSDTTASQGEEEKPEGYVETDFSKLSDAEKNTLTSLMPTTLPGGKSYEIVSRTMCFDNGEEDYSVAGNTGDRATFVGTEDGALYGKAVKFPGAGKNTTLRGEIEVTPWGDVIVEDACGVLFYVDFSNVQINEDKLDSWKGMCASVTLNTNDYRSNMSDPVSVGWYYSGGEWVETHCVNACRMEIPFNFVGWIYVPASSYQYTKTNQPVGDTFGDIFVLNMRCYTDHYVYSNDSYIIFDEITFVK